MGLIRYLVVTDGRTDRQTELPWLIRATYTGTAERVKRTKNTNSYSYRQRTIHSGRLPGPDIRVVCHWL